MSDVNNGNDIPTVQGGPWWSRVLTNKNAVIALVAIYLLYFVTGVLDTRLRDLSTANAEIKQAVTAHHSTEELNDAMLKDLLIRMVDQAVINTRLQREICASNAKNSTAVRKCYDPDVK